MCPPTVLLLCLVLAAVAPCQIRAHGHSHDDGHSHDEPAAYKWSRQANEDPIMEDDIDEEDIVDVPTQYSKEKPSE